MKKRILVNLIFPIAAFLFSLVSYAEFSYMGVTNRQVQSLVLANYKNELIVTNLKILLFYLLIGALVFFFSTCLRLERVKGLIGFNVAVWAFFWIRAVKLFPQMYAEQLYKKGNPYKMLQIFVTDWVPLWTLYALFFLLLLVIALKKKRYVGGMAVFVCILIWLLPIKQIPFRPSSQAAMPNVLILASDSLRPDHISYNGYQRKTPHLDYLFSRGANFTRMQSSLARTFPSWTSILTSLYPPQHRIRHMFPSFADRQKKWLTLVDVLRAKGYDTSVISDFAGDIFPRIDYGFENISAPRFTFKTLIQQRSLEIHYFFLSFFLTPHGRTIFPVLSEMAFNPDPFFLVEKTKEKIGVSLKKSQPFFILTFFSANHFPYCPRFPYYRLYTSSSYRGSHKYKKENLLSEYKVRRIEGLEKEQVVALYDGGVRMFDDAVGEVLDFLQASGADRHTLVVIMSDHGENLYDEDYGMGHGDHLRGDLANSLAFGVYSPHENFAGRIIHPTARDIDVAPTILDLLGLPIPPPFQGVSLLPYMRGKEFPGLMAYMETGIWYTHSILNVEGAGRIFYPEITDLLEVDPTSGEMILKDRYRFEVINAKHRAFRSDTYKYIMMPDEQGVRVELYEVDRPQVLKNRIKDAPYFYWYFRNLFLKFFPGHFYYTDLNYLIEADAFPDSFLSAYPSSPYESRLK